MQRANDDAGAFQELFFWRAGAVRIEAESAFEVGRAN